MKTKITLTAKLFGLLFLMSLMLAYIPMAASATEAIPSVTVSFDANGGEALEPITVTPDERYGKLPSSAITGLSGGDSNWYLVDEKGNITDTKITKLTKVTLTNDHTLFVKRVVLAPSLKIVLEVPGAVSDAYQYYIPENSKRVLTVTISNQNTDVLDYTYAWYKDGTEIEGSTEATLVLDGNVSDSGLYTVKVTATLKAESNITATETTASAETSQTVKILHASNTLYYDANGGEEGPINNFTGGTTITVAKEVPTRTGFVFDGWNTKADGTGENYPGGSTYTFAEDNGNGGCTTTLYAQWIKLYDVYVGGVQVTERNQHDVFGDGRVSYDAETNTLTLHDYSYEGEGYRYGNSADGVQSYSAAIYSNGSITIKLAGANTLINTFNGKGQDQYGDGVVSEGCITFVGDGSLFISASFAIDADDDITIDGSKMILEAIDDGISANNGSVIIKNNAKVDLTVAGYGIYAYKDVTIIDSELNIEADFDGIYSYDGTVEIGCTNVAISANGLWLTGTKVTIHANGYYGIFAFKGLIIDEKLTISSPENGVILDVTDEDSVYSTIAIGETAAKDIVIEPLGYTVSIHGLSYSMSVLVPAYQSVNQAYSERLGVEDFSEALDTHRVGYIFAGWYTDETYTSGMEFNFGDAVTADINIYAKWASVYAPVVEETEGGDVTVSPETATKGEIVIITAEPDEGKEVDTVTVTDKDGNSVSVTKNDDGSYSFAQPESEVKIKVTYKDKESGTEGKPTDPPQAGDSHNVLWFALIMICGSAVVMLTVCEKKKRTE